MSGVCIETAQMEPSDVGYPALSIEYWVNELAELAYDIDDCVDKLVHIYM